ncbi:MAG: glucose 1-dehydrogenase [Ruminococcaceae bacterium]|nr:glucose 1-dehydrogenase [Oscillospiraceae bacterium]
MKTVWITGGTRGIGATTAKLFFEKGYRVAVSFSSNQEAAREFQKEYPNILVVQGDVSDAQQVKAMAKQIGNVSILINNAGIAQQKLFDTITEKEWDQMFDIHVKGAYLCTQAVLPHMLHQKEGSIINMSSMWGLTGASCEVHYSAAKGALIAMTKALAKELGPSNIRVNCVAPGVIDTEMCAHLTEEDKASLCDETPLGRLGTPEDVAEAIYYLATAEFITGQILSPNGGIVI